MKLVVAVVQDKDKKKVMDGLLERGFKFTNIASTGGFLREGNTTFLVGVEPDRVQDVIDLIGASSKTREQFVNVFPPTMEPVGTVIPSPVRVKVGGAVIFVLDVETFQTV